MPHQVSVCAYSAVYQEINFNYHNATYTHVCVSNSLFFIFFFNLYASHMIDWNKKIILLVFFFVMFCWELKFVFSVSDCAAVYFFFFLLAVSVCTHALKMSKWRVGTDFCQTVLVIVKGRGKNSSVFLQAVEHLGQSTFTLYSIMFFVFPVSSSYSHSVYDSFITQPIRIFFSVLILLCILRMHLSFILFLHSVLFSLWCWYILLAKKYAGLYF